MRIPMWRRVERMLGPDPGADVDDEIAHHLEMRTRDLMRRGMDEGSARAEAGRRFGDLKGVRAEVVRIDRSGERRLRLGRLFGELVSDARMAVRGLRRSPGFAAAAVITLGLGIGGNLAVFSAVDAVLFRPLPFADPDRLVMLWEENPERGWERETAAPANFLDWREGVDAFADVGAYASFQDARVIADELGPPELVRTVMASGNLFQVLGVAPAAGAFPGFADTWQGGEPFAVISHELWRGRFGGDPASIGRAVELDDEVYRLTGVLPEGFELRGSPADVWVSFGWDPAAAGDPAFRRAHWIRPVARLAPGASAEAAEAELAALARRLEAEYPETNRAMGAGLTPLHDFLVGDLRPTLIVVLGAVGLLLLLACANVGNLLLVKGVRTRRETAVRAALGAGRWRLVRLALAESLVLSGLGAVAGLALAWVLLRAVTATGGLSRVPGIGALALDGRLLLYLVGIALLSSILFGLAPALLGSGARGLAALRDGGRSGGTRGTRHALGGLVAAEVALAVLLLAGALLLTRSFQEVRQADAGFVAEGVLTATVTLPDSRYGSDAEVAVAYEGLRERLAAIPGVSSVGAVRRLPLTGPGWSSDFTIEGRAPADAGVEILHREVTPGYFETLRVPLLRGRTIAETDRADGAPVVVVNELLADRYFPDADPLGARIAFTRTPDESTRWWTIVGVVGSERQAGATAEPRIEIFAPVAQDPTRGMSFVVRSGLDAPALAAAVRAAISEFDPRLVPEEIQTLSEVRSAAMAREELLATLFAAFAAIALVLSIVGVYGVTAQSVRTRQQEIGIRLALGAERARVAAALTAGSMTPLVAGLVAGLAATLLAAGTLSALLYGVAARDPSTLGAAAALILLAGGAAAFLPAVRAGRSDPAAILRQE